MTQASRHSWQGIVDGRVNEADVSTAASDSSAVYCAAERTRAKVPVRYCPSTQPEPASRLIHATRDVSLLRSDSPFGPH